MTIREAIEALGKLNAEDNCDLAMNAKYDAVKQLTEHWADVADCWGGDGLDGKTFKRSFMSDLDDVFNWLEEFKTKAGEILKDIPDDIKHNRGER